MGERKKTACYLCVEVRWVLILTSILCNSTLSSFVVDSMMVT